MPEKSGFFDTTADDPRVYPAREFAEYFSRFIGNGIFGGGTVLRVTASGADNKISIDLGFGWINGYLYSIFSEPLSKTLPLATTLDRIDRVVLRLNVSTPVRTIKLTVLQGTPNSNPTPPPLVRSGDIYDLSLSQVRMLANTTTIQQHQIIDERLDNTVCGIVTGLIQQADTTQIFNEFYSWMEQQKIAYRQEWRDFMDSIQDEGFASTQYVDNAVAAHLADFTQQIPYAVTAGSANAYTASTIPALPALVAGVAITVKFHVANTGASTLNWQAKGAKSIRNPDGTAVASGDLASGGVYTLRYDGTNFILQGKGEVKLTGDAADANVLLGKTYYSTDPKTKRTGTMPNNPSQTATLQITGSAKPTKAVPAGYTPGGTITAELATALASKILSGNIIGGVAGTAVDGAGMKKFASGEVYTNIGIYNVRGLSFQPKIVITRCAVSGASQTQYFSIYVEPSLINNSTKIDARTEGGTSVISQSTTIYSDGFSFYSPSGTAYPNYWIAIG